MMKEILIAIGVPLGGGLFWLAYNHPKSYFQVCSILQIVNGACMIAAMAWIQGYSDGASGARDKISDPSLSLKIDHYPDWLINPFFIILGFLAIHGFLWMLTQIHMLKDDK